MGWHFLSRGSSQLRDRTCVSCLAGGFFTTEPPGKPNSIFTWSHFFNLPEIRYLNQSLIWLLFLFWLHTSFPVKWFEANVGVWETWLKGSWFGDIACLFGLMGSIYVVCSLLCAELTYYWLFQCRNVSGVLLLPTMLNHRGSRHRDKWPELVGPECALGCPAMEEKQGLKRYGSRNLSSHMWKI